jgi:hypothetical protein
MEKTVRYYAFAALGITLILLLVGQVPAAGQSGDSVSSGANPDMVVVISEDYLNRVIKADLEEKNPMAVKDVSVQLMENEPIEVNAVISLGLGPLAKDQNVAVEANVSIVNDTLKVEPKVLKVGFLNLPEQTWVGPIKSAMQEVEASANDAYQDALMKGYKVTSVTTGNNTLTLSVMAPDKPFEMK